VFQEKTFKNLKKKRFGNISPNSKKIKGKGKERKRRVKYLLFTLHLMKLGGELLVSFDNELTTFRHKNNKLICNVEKIK